MLGPGRTSVHTPQPGRTAAYSNWIGWQGDVSTHRNGDRTTFIKGCPQDALTNNSSSKLIRSSNRHSSARPKDANTNNSSSNLVRSRNRHSSGLWYQKFLCRDCNRAPTVETGQLPTELGDPTPPTMGALIIAGTPFASPQRQDRETHALYVVHVTTRAHGQLSTMMNRMEERLHLEHVHRYNYHLSIDVPPEDAWEIVD